MGEALTAYAARMRTAALEDWRYRTLVWAIRSAFATKAPSPPQMPEILMEDLPTDGNEAGN